VSSLHLRNVGVAFPLYGHGSYSIKKRLVGAATGGRIGTRTGVAVVEALRNISLTLRDGDRLGVIGHNGSGKSTLLRTLAGVYPPSAGSYCRQGNIASLIDPTLGIEPDATGYENIVIMGLLQGRTLHSVKQLIPSIADFSGLGEYLDMPVRTYSTGMLMRLGFSITTCVKPDILLMDEWLAVGDLDFSNRAAERLRSIVDHSGILVLASHSEELIKRECTSLIELSHGEIIRHEQLTVAA
jgi:lipopolysaccharide transport system ATP-binding protein